MEKSGYIETALCNNRAMGAALGKGQKEVRRLVEMVDIRNVVKI